MFGGDWNSRIMAMSYRDKLGQHSGHQQYGQQFPQYQAQPQQRQYNNRHDMRQQQPQQQQPYYNQQPNYYPGIVCCVFSLFLFVSYFLVDRSLLLRNAFIYNLLVCLLLFFFFEMK